MFAPGWLLVSLLALFNVESPCPSGKFEDGHVRWNFSSVKRSKSEWDLLFTAKVDRGWHLYSQNLDEGGPMPTTFRFSKDESVKLLGKVKETGVAQTVYDSTFMMNVDWYENEVVFTQRVKVKADVRVTGEINYSVCSEERCIPGTVTFNIDIDR